MQRARFGNASELFDDFEKNRRKYARFTFASNGLHKAFSERLGATVAVWAVRHEPIQTSHALVGN